MGHIKPICIIRREYPIKLLLFSPPVISPRQMSWFELYFFKHCFVPGSPPWFPRRFPPAASPWIAPTRPWPTLQPSGDPASVRASALQTRRLVPQVGPKAKRPHATRTGGEVSIVHLIWLCLSTPGTPAVVFPGVSLSPKKSLGSSLAITAQSSSGRHIPGKGGCINIMCTKIRIGLILF